MTAPVIVALPTADRPTTHRFYRDGLGFEPIGEPAEDGVPEPLQFAVNDGLRLMFVPTDGFESIVLGGREVAAPGRSECVLCLSAADEAEVQDVIGRARRAGATVVTEPVRRPWDYSGAFADPDGHVWMVQAT